MVAIDSSLIYLNILIKNVPARLLTFSEPVMTQILLGGW